MTTIFSGIGGKIGPITFTLWRKAIVAGLWFALLRTAYGAEQPTEYEVKAAFLFNFSKFIEWPSAAFENNQSPVIIGLVGENSMEEILTTLVKGEKVKNRAISIRRFSANDDLTPCHLLFVSRSEGNRTKAILDRLKKRCILTIGEMDDFLKLGGMISFVIVQENVRFDINQKALEQAGLKASSRLLAVARSVNN